MKKFLVRAIIGCLLIFGVNMGLEMAGVPVSVGFNFISFLTAGALGFPGVALLYAIIVFQIL